MIKPHKTWFGINFRELYAYHELLYFLTWRDVKVRYKQTLLGVAWAVLQPLCMMAIFAIFFGKVVGIPSDGVPYPIFAFAGLLPWIFFSTAVINSGGSLIGNANLITKVYFPRLIVPTAAVAAVLVDFCISFLALLALMVYYRISITSSLLILPLLVMILIGFTLAFGTLMAALTVRYRDVRLILTFLIQLWFFATPIIYPSSLIPERWRWVLSVNPMTGIIEGFRSALLGSSQFNWASILSSALVTIALLVCATATFRRMENTFADIV